MLVYKQIYKEIKNICKYAYISNTSYNIPHIYYTSYYNSKKSTLINNYR